MSASSDESSPNEPLRTTAVDRVEAFSDGVFAIALTLLVLDLIVEHAAGHYRDELLAQWPRYVAYLVAFVTIASQWLNHHDAFSRLERVDPAVRTQNLVLLLGVSLVPWPTALLASALAETRGGLDDQRAAVLVYVLVSLIVAVGWIGSSVAVIRRPHLLADAGDVRWFRRNVRNSVVAGIFSITAGAIGWVVPLAALVLLLLVPLAFILISRRAARAD